MALLEVKGVSLSFSGLRALSEISFGMEDGQIMGLIGPNGADKSTLLNCISRLYHPESGSLRFNGLDLVNLKSHEVAALGIRRTFQNLELFREANARENVALGLVYRYRSSLLSDFLNLPSARAKRRAANAEADEILDSFALRDIADTRVSDLSYGLQKSVEMARALAGRPKLLLLDKMIGHNTVADPVVLDLAGPEALEGIYVNLMTAVSSMDTPAVKNANEILAKYYPQTKPGYYPYLGMAGGIIIVEAMKRAGAELTAPSSSVRSSRLAISSLVSCRRSTGASPIMVDRKHSATLSGGTVSSW